MSKLLRLLLFLALLLGQPVQAVFTYASHLSNGKQNIYFFHDTHEASERSPEHQIQVVNFAKQLDATLLTEEMTDMNTLRRYIHDERLLAQIQLDCMELLQKEESEKFPLRGLSLFARSMGVDAKNIDYRQWADAFRTGRSISGKAAMQVLDQIIEEIKSYDDNPVFNALYKKYVNLVTKEFKPLWDYLRLRDEMVGDLAQTDEFKDIIASVKNRSINDDRNYGEFWIIYDSRLFDCLLLHELAQQRNNHVVVCAGSLHCDFALELLQEIGFAKINPESPSFGLTSMDLRPFMQKVVRGTVPSITNKISRKEIISREVSELVRESNRVFEVSWRHETVSNVTLLIILHFIFIICCTSMLIRRAYIARLK